MSDTLTLAAETRDRVGKGASRSLRREGRVPAVIYGQNKAPVAIHLEERALVKALGTGHFMTTVVTVAGERTLPKDVALHPVTDRPVHVDFLRISADARVVVSIPVVFTDEKDAPFTKAGGVLNVVRHDVEVTCDAAEIPAALTISLAGRIVGDSIHISDVALPQGVQPSIDDRDFTIATIVPPTVPTAADDAADAAAAADEVPATAQSGDEASDTGGAEGDASDGGEQA